MLGRGGRPCAWATTAGWTRGRSRSFALENPRKEGDNLVVGTPAGAAGAGQVRAGALEASGSDAARSMVDMIASLRAFEAGQRVIHDDRRDAAEGRERRSARSPADALRRSAQAAANADERNACSKDSTPPRRAWLRSSSAWTPSPTTSPTRTPPATRSVRVGFRDLVYTQAGRPSAQGPRTGAGAAAVDAGPRLRAGLGAAHRAAVRRRDPGRRLPPRPPRRRRRQALTRDGSLQARRHRQARDLDRRARAARRSPSPTATDPSNVSIGPDGTLLAGGRRSAASSSSPCARRRACSRSATTPSLVTPQSGADPRRARRHDPRPGRARDAPTSTSPTRWSAMIESQRAFQLTSKAIQTAGPDVGDRQRGQALMPTSALRRRRPRRGAARGGPRRHGRRQAGLQGRARLREGPARRARQGDDQGHAVAERRPARRRRQRRHDRRAGRRAAGSASPPQLYARRCKAGGDRRDRTRCSRRSCSPTSTTRSRSAQPLLRLVLAQGEAIRARDVERVLAKLAEIQTEMGRRGRLEQERTRAAAARRRAARRPRPARHARAPVRADHPRGRPRPRASAPPSCAACSARSRASTASTAR